MGVCSFLAWQRYARKKRFARMNAQRRAQWEAEIQRGESRGVVPP